jgi:hypothetical protein
MTVAIAAPAHDVAGKPAGDNAHENNNDETFVR